MLHLLIRARSKVTDLSDHLKYPDTWRLTFRSRDKKMGGWMTTKMDRKTDRRRIFQDYHKPTKKNERGHQRDTGKKLHLILQNTLRISEMHLRTLQRPQLHIKNDYNRIGIRPLNILWDLHWCEFLGIRSSKHAREVCG